MLPEHPYFSNHEVDVPVSYELGLEEDPNLAIILRVHKEVQGQVHTAFGRMMDPNIMEMYLRDVSCLEPATEGGFGFGSILEPISSDLNYLRWRYQLRPIGRRSLGMDRDVAHAYNLSATLREVFREINLEAKATTGPAFQLMTLELATRQKQNGANIVAYFAPRLRSWLAKDIDVAGYDTLRSVLLSSWHLMEPGHGEFSDFNLRVSNQRGSGFEITVPGDAAGLYVPGYKHFRNGKGWELETHNMDNMSQQIAVLVALAKLHDMARADGI